MLYKFYDGVVSNKQPHISLYVVQWLTGQLFVHVCDLSVYISRHQPYWQADALGIMISVCPFILPSVHYKTHSYDIL